MSLDIVIKKIYVLLYSTRQKARTFNTNNSLQSLLRSWVNCFQGLHFFMWRLQLLWSEKLAWQIGQQKLWFPWILLCLETFERRTCEPQTVHTFLPAFSMVPWAEDWCSVRFFFNTNSLLQWSHLKLFSCGIKRNTMDCDYHWNLSYFK